jgi:hypothetical protein
MPLKGKPVLEFQELTIYELEHTLREATREDGMNPVLVNYKAQASQRLLAIRAYNGKRVNDNGGKVSGADLIADMSVKALQLYQAAMDRVHDPTEAETSAFFESLESQEVP